jgi:hypothetical protein
MNSFFPVNGDSFFFLSFIRTSRSKSHILSILNNNDKRTKHISLYISGDVTASFSLLILFLKTSKCFFCLIIKIIIKICDVGYTIRKFVYKGRTSSSN